METKCSSAKCKNIAETYCNCKISNYFCQEHIVLHMKKVGAHLFNSVCRELDDKLKNDILKAISTKLKLMDLIKNEAKKALLEGIDTLIFRYNEALQQITAEQRNYRALMQMIINKGEIERKHYDQLLSLKEQNCINFHFSTVNLKQEIQSLFEYNLTLNCNNQEDDEYFWIDNRGLVKINLETLKMSVSHVDQLNQLNQYYYYGQTQPTYSCKLSANNFFVIDPNSGQYYLLDLKGCTASNITPPEVSCQWPVLAFIEDSVYMIEGNTTGLKYSITAEQWSNISISPLPNGHTIGGRLLNKICLASQSEYNGFIYDPVLNKYSSILKLPGGGIIIGYGYILTEHCFYKMKKNDIFSWDENKYNSKYGDCCCNMKNSYVFNKGMYLYVYNCQEQLFRFDMARHKYTFIEDKQFVNHECQSRNYY